jgi:hypothetical protein
MSGQEEQADPDHPPHLVFGIFPGIAGTEDVLYGESLKSYDPRKTDEAIAQLQADGSPFLVRSYNLFKGLGCVENQTPPDVTRFIHGNRRLDYVLCYRSPDGDLDDWIERILRIVREQGPSISSLQIAEEANNPDATSGGDGSFPNVRQALVSGVIAAAEEAERLGLSVDIGCNATPIFSPNDDFWPSLLKLGSHAFIDALDYVGLDFFPDVFRPVPADDLAGAVAGVLGHFREANLASGGIGSAIPIRITENGWPTSAARSPVRQAEVLKTVVGVVHDLRGKLNITQFECFALRDAVGGRPNALIEWGLLQADYQAKPAFEAYRRLIRELGVQSKLA